MTVNGGYLDRRLLRTEVGTPGMRLGYPEKSSMLSFAAVRRDSGGEQKEGER